jgi:hypothetical protein
MKYLTSYILTTVLLCSGALWAQSTDKQSMFIQKVNAILSDPAEKGEIHVAELRLKANGDPSGGKYGDFVIARESYLTYSAFKMVSGQIFSDSTVFLRPASVSQGCSFVPRYILTTRKKNADVILFSSDCKQLAISSVSFREIKDIAGLNDRGAKQIEIKFNRLLSAKAYCQLTVGKLELFFSSDPDVIKQQITDQGFDIECEEGNSIIASNIPLTTERSFKKLFETWPGVDSVKSYSRGLASSGPIVITLQRGIATDVLKEQCEKFCKTYFTPGTLDPIKSGPFFLFFDVNNLRNRIFQKKNYYERINFSIYLGLNETNNSVIVITPNIYIAGGSRNPPPSAYSLADNSLSEDAEVFLRSFSNSLEAHLIK